MTMTKDDLISRKAALNLSCSITGRKGDAEIIKKCFEAYRDHIKSLPSAEAVHIETYRELYEKYVELKHASAEPKVFTEEDYWRATEPAHGTWISRIDTGTWMLECSVCGCRVQEEKYRIAVGESATRCPYCGAELGLGGYSYEEYANRPSQRESDGEE